MIRFCEEKGPKFATELVRYENVNVDILFCFLNISMTSTATVRFKERMTYDKFSDAVTVFDEAFALLIFENNFKRWSYMAERHVKKNNNINQGSNSTNSVQNTIGRGNNNNGIDEDESTGTSDENSSREEVVPDETKK